jgi:hypothetical protein
MASKQRITYNFIERKITRFIYDVSLANINNKILVIILIIKIKKEMIRFFFIQEQTSKKFTSTEIIEISTRNNKALKPNGIHEFISNFFSKKELNQLELLLEIAKSMKFNVQTSMKKHLNFVAIENDLLDFLINLSFFMKPKCLILIYAVYSPFFDFFMLEQFKKIDNNRLCFPILDLFDLSYYIYYFNNEQFEYADDSKFISYKTIYSETDDYNLNRVIEFFKCLKNKSETTSNKETYSAVHGNNIFFNNIYPEETYYKSILFKKFYFDGKTVSSL